MVKPFNCHKQGEWKFFSKLINREVLNVPNKPNNVPIKKKGVHENLANCIPYGQSMMSRWKPIGRFPPLPGGFPP